jgi:hypothetical protein
MRDTRAWQRLVRKVEAVVKIMPLWKLQTVGKEKLDFLYGENNQDGTIELRPGVAYCFRQFYSLIQDAVRSAWLRDVRASMATCWARAWIFGSFYSARNGMHWQS